MALFADIAKMPADEIEFPGLRQLKQTEKTVYKMPVEKVVNKEFFIINNLIVDSGLLNLISNKALRLYIILLRFKQPGNYGYIYHKKIYSSMKISKKHLHELFAELVKYKLIVVKRDVKNRQYKIYKIIRKETATPNKDINNIIKT